MEAMGTVKSIATEKGYSCYRLAKESGVPYATVNELWRSHSSPEDCKAGTLYRLARVLGVSMEALMNREEL